MLQDYYDESRIRHGRPLAASRNLQPPVKKAAMSEDERDSDLLSSTLLVEQGIENWREKRKIAYASRGHTRARKSFEEFVVKTKKRGFTFARLNAAKQVYNSYVSRDRFCIVYNDFLDTGGTENASFMDELENLRDIGQPHNVQFFGHYGVGKSRVSRAHDHAYVKKIGKNPRYVMDCYDVSRHNMEVAMFPEFPHAFTRDEDKDDPARWSKDFVNIYYGFSFDHARHIIQNLQSRQEISHLDEILKLHDKGSRIEVDDLNNVIKSSNRAKDLNMNSTTPDPVEIAQVDFYYRVLAWNRKEETTLVMRCYAEGKESEGKELVLVDDAILVFSVKEPEVLTKFVEMESLEIKNKIKQRGGHTKARNADVKAIASTLVTIYNELDDEEDKEYYGSTKAALKEFAELDEDVSASAGRNLDLVVSRAWWKLKHKAPPARQGSTPGQELAAVPPTDAEIVAAELAMLLASDPRVKYLQQGLNVTLEAIADLDAGTKTNEDLATISRRRNDKARREFMAANFVPCIDFEGSPVASGQKPGQVEVIEETTGWRGFRDLPASMIIEHPITLVTYNLREKAAGVLDTHDITGVIFRKDGSMDLLFNKRDVAATRQQASYAGGHVKGTSKFTPVEDEILKRHPNQRDVEIWKKCTREGIKQAQFKKIFKIGQSAVSKIINAIGKRADDGSTSSGWLTQEIGHEFEGWICEVYQAERGAEIEKIENHGREHAGKGVNPPDVVVRWKAKKITIVAGKCEFTTNARTPKRKFTRDDLGPEIAAAFEEQAKHPDCMIETELFYCNRWNGKLERKIFSFTSFPDDGVPVMAFDQGDRFGQE